MNRDSFKPDNFIELHSIVVCKAIEIQDDIVIADLGDGLRGKISCNEFGESGVKIGDCFEAEIIDYDVEELPVLAFGKVIPFYEIKPYSFVRAEVSKIEGSEVFLRINKYKFAKMSLSDIEGESVDEGDIIEAEVVALDDGNDYVLLGWGRIAEKKEIVVHPPIDDKPKDQKTDGYRGGYDISGKRIIMSGVDKINDLQIGDVFLFGNQDRPIPWTVYSANSTQIFLLCNHVLVQKKYFEAVDFLKNEFWRIHFTKEEKAYINDIRLPGKDYIMQKLDEEERVGVHIRKKMRNRCFYYWTCTSGNKGTHYSININGYAVVSSDWEKLGVRPFLVLNKIKSEEEPELREKEQVVKQARKFIKVW